MKIKWFDSFPENPSNPAQTNMATGEIEINRSVYDLLPSYMKEFVLNHEIGHYVLKTLNEEKADDYALSKMALKSEYSLKLPLPKLNWGSKRMDVLSENSCSRRTPNLLPCVKVSPCPVSWDS